VQNNQDRQVTNEMENKRALLTPLKKQGVHTQTTQKDIKDL